jgi:hypothetical protein
MLKSQNTAILNHSWNGEDNWRLLPGPFLDIPRSHSLSDSNTPQQGAVRSAYSGSMYLLTPVIAEGALSTQISGTTVICLEPESV